MRYWKVILATLVIFAAGAITGGLVVNQMVRAKSTTASPSPTNRSVATRNVVWPTQASPVPSTNLAYWYILKTNYLKQAQKELNLTAEQQDRIEMIISESQKRTKELSDAMAPKVRDEVRRARDRMRAELTPEQRRKYDLLYKSRSPRKPPEIVHAVPASSNTPAPVVLPK